VEFVVVGFVVVDVESCSWSVNVDDDDVVDVVVDDDVDTMILGASVYCIR
jgi:hypothetical protein